MEDAATAEISRSQVWQWLHNDVTLADTGHQVTRELIDRIVEEEIAKLPRRRGRLRGGEADVPRGGGRRTTTRTS